MGGSIVLGLALELHFAMPGQSACRLDGKTLPLFLAILFRERIIPLDEFPDLAVHISALAVDARVLVTFIRDAYGHFVYVHGHLLSGEGNFRIRELHASVVAVSRRQMSAVSVLTFTARVAAFRPLHYRRTIHNTLDWINVKHGELQKIAPVVRLRLGCASRALR